MAQQASFGMQSGTPAQVEVVGQRVLATLVDAAVLGVAALVVFVAQWVISLIFLGASGGLDECCVD